MAYNLYSPFIGNPIDVDSCLKRGGEPKPIMADSASPAAEEANDCKIGARIRSLGLMAFDQSQVILAEYRKSLPGQVEFRLTPLYPACAIQEILAAGPKKASIKVDLYGFNAWDAERRSFVVPYDGEGNYRYFHDQFQTVWERPTLE